MNCSEHNEVVAVAACPCGKALCSECERRHHPPNCEACYIGSLERLRSKTITRICINVVCYIPYLMVMTQTHIGNDDIMILGLIWGFFGFRWLMDAFFALTRIAIFASFEGWGGAYFIGSLVCSFTGFVVIPVQVVLQVIQLRKVNESLKPRGVPRFAGTTSTPA